MAWTTSDLQNSQYVQTQMTEQDRSSALTTVQSNITNLSTREAQLQSTIDSLESQRVPRGELNAARTANDAIQADPNATTEQKLASAQAYTELKNRSDAINNQYAQAIDDKARITNALDANKTALTNIEATGTTVATQSPPTPVGDNPVNPPAEVLDSANPNPVPGDEDVIYDTLADPPLDEFEGIDEQVADNELAIQEPPELTEEEAEAYLRDTEPGDGEIQPPGIEDQPIPDEEFLSSQSGISTDLDNTRAQATEQDQANAYAQGDWRVRLSLAPSATYLYASDDPGILYPLLETDGILFPYTPSISVNYSASYDGQNITHSNYKIFQYGSSSVDNIQITCDFTAQDTHEANYLLAVIHFLKSVTKMFYGQDSFPVNGTPPPLCYLTGLGAYQFDRHPLAITSFNYTLPTDVDYIQTGSAAEIAGLNRQQTGKKPTSRLGDQIAPGGVKPGARFATVPTGSVTATYVPTKMQISISAVPIVSRNDISRIFSLNAYGKGILQRGSVIGGTGIW